MQTNEYVADRFGAAGATLMAVGIMLSGPIGLGVVTLTHPAAPWTSAEAYAHQFHWVQTLPFYAGFVLLAGMHHGDQRRCSPSRMTRSVRGPARRLSRRRRSRA
jgi:hypothetical protein